MTMGHGHGVGHGSGAESDTGGGSTPLWMRVALGLVVLAIAAAAAVGMWALRPTGVGRPHVQGLGFAAGVAVLHGQVASIAPLDCSQLDFSDPTLPPRTPSKNARCGRARVALSSGAESGRTVSVDLPPEVRAGGLGLRILVMKVPGVGQGSPYTFYDVERTRPLLALAGLFVLVVVAVARGRGLRALLGLGLAAFVVVKYLLPALLEGHNPVQLGLAVSVAIMVVVLYLTHGVSTRTTTALLGTFAGLGITAAVGAVAVTQVHLTGVTSEEATMLQQVAPQLDLRHLLTCGIILAGLGILNDVTITQSSAVWELHEAGAGPGRLRLYRQAMRIGRDHIASTVYTIVFAYAGAALSVLLLISMADAPMSMILTSNDIAEELVRTMASAIGLVLAVPATTALAVMVVSSARRQQAQPGAPLPDSRPAGDDHEAARESLGMSLV
jgi:uncharacterized membrane protein